MPMSIFGILNHVENISRVTYMQKYGIFGKAAVPKLKIIQIYNPGKNCVDSKLSKDSVTSAWR